jgi:hypothetical protein
MSNRAYLIRRAVQEEELASTSRNAVVAAAHAAMASEYRRRLREVERRIQPFRTRDQIGAQLDRSSA